jgi:excisionase family DNA binding protein
MSRAATEQVSSMTDVLTLSQAAALLQLSQATVTKLAKSGAIIGRKVGSQWRFLRTDLEAYVHGGTRQKAG